MVIPNTNNLIYLCKCGWTGKGIQMMTYQQEPIEVDITNIYQMWRGCPKCKRAIGSMTVIGEDPPLHPFKKY